MMRDQCITEYDARLKGSQVQSGVAPEIGE